MPKYIYNGKKYDSLLEIKVGKFLEEEKINFDTHQEVKLKYENHNAHDKRGISEVDFKLKGSKIYIEVFGNINKYKNFRDKKKKKTYEKNKVNCIFLEENTIKTKNWKWYLLKEIDKRKLENTLKRFSMLMGFFLTVLFSSLIFENHFISISKLLNFENSFLFLFLKILIPILLYILIFFVVKLLVKKNQLNLNKFWEFLPYEEYHDFMKYFFKTEFIQDKYSNKKFMLSKWEKRNN